MWKSKDTIQVLRIEPAQQQALLPTELSHHSPIFGFCLYTRSHRIALSGFKHYIAELYTMDSPSYVTPPSTYVARN